MPVYRMQPDNFTPPERTPWGGQRIKQIKAGLTATDYRCVGESWEISTDAQFPSRIVGTNKTLRDVAPDLPFLVKIIDTAEPLSVQVHPPDDFVGLKANECGKPEAWFVYDAQPGAGVYLGFQPNVSANDIRRCLTSSGAMNELMNFVPVKKNDVFTIVPGVAHAIGAGVTLVEPQSIVPGKIGVTYRFWDWNRVYDGKSRQLHIEQAMAVVRLDAGNPRTEGCVRTPTYEACFGAASAGACVVLEGEVTSGQQRFTAGESFISDEAIAAAGWCVTTRRLV